MSKKEYKLSEAETGEFKRKVEDWCDEQNALNAREHLIFKCISKKANVGLKEGESGRQRLECREIGSLLGSGK